MAQGAEPARLLWFVARARVSSGVQNGKTEVLGFGMPVGMLATPLPPFLSNDTPIRSSKRASAVFLSVTFAGWLY